MADIVIRGMEMPKNCYSCPLADLEDFECNLIDRAFISYDMRCDKRLEDCPLVPLPEPQKEAQDGN